MTKPIDLLQVLQTAANELGEAVHCKHMEQINTVPSHIYMVQVNNDHTTEVECVEGHICRVHNSYTRYAAYHAHFAAEAFKYPSYVHQLMQALTRRATLHVPDTLHQAGSTLTVDPMQ